MSGTWPHTRWPGQPYAHLRLRRLQRRRPRFRKHSPTDATPSRICVRAGAVPAVPVSRSHGYPNASTMAPSRSKSTRGAAVALAEAMAQARAVHCTRTVGYGGT